MGRLSVNFSDQEEIYLKKLAAKEHLSISALIRQTIFQEINHNQFNEFREIQLEANEEIGKLLVELVKQIRFTASLSADCLRTVRPDDAMQRINKIHKDIFEEGV